MIGWLVGLLIDWVVEQRAAVIMTDWHGTRHIGVWCCTLAILFVISHLAQVAERSSVVSVSVCVSVCLSASISPKLHVRSSPDFPPGTGRRRPGVPLQQGLDARPQAILGRPAARRPGTRQRADRGLAVRRTWSTIVDTALCREVTDLSTGDWYPQGSSLLAVIRDNRYILSFEA